MNSLDLINAIVQLKEDRISSRVCVVVRTALDVRLVQRTIALSPSGLVGVDVWTWSDLANELLEVVGESGKQAASLRQVAEIGVAPALQDFEGSTQHVWLGKSSGHTDSIYRLARAFIKASTATSSVEQVLPVPDLEPIAAAVESNLASAGLLLPGRALLEAAVLLESGSSPSVSRLIPSLIVVGDEKLLSTSERCLREVLTNCVPSVVVSPAQTQHIDARATRAVITPNPLIEARVVTRQVHDWLAAGVLASSIAVVTPQQAGFQGMLSNQLDGLGIEHWTGISQGSLASTYAARVLGALAKSLDSMSGCSVCSANGLSDTSDANSEHDCRGIYTYVSEVIRAALGGSEFSREILASAADLNLQYGLRNWATLLRWHLGEDETLAEVTARNVSARQADPESDRPRGVVSRVSDSPELLDKLKPGIDALLLILSPVGAGELDSFVQRSELLIEQSKQSGRPLRAGGMILQALRASASVGARRLEGLVSQIVKRPTSNIDSVGMGVGVFSVAQISSVACTHVAWCGLAEGAAPILTKPDPLVAKDSEIQAAIAHRNAVAAHRLIGIAVESLITVSRVALGSRESLIASRWFMQWSGSQGIGASEIMRARSLESIKVIESSLAGMVLYPMPADQARQHSDSVARTLLNARVALNSPEASEFDGLLGAFPDWGDAHDLSWLSALPLRRSIRGGDSGSSEPAPVSPSALSSFVACPRQFFYKKIVGLRASQQPSLEVDVPANTWGTFVHTALEGDFERLIPLSTEDRKRELCEVMEKQFPGYLPFFTGSEQQLASRIRVQAEAINNTIKWSDLASRSDYESEKYLKADFAGITIAGYADFAWPDHVADAKTGKMKSGAELVKDRVQVQAYSAILAKESDQVVSGELWYLSSKGAAVVSTGVTGETEAQAPVFLTAIDSLKFAVDQGVFPAVGDNSGEMGTTCLYCDFNKICPTDIHDRWEEVKQDEQFSRVHPIKESGGLSSQTEGESA